jgi:hypothetical protein
MRALHGLQSFVILKLLSGRKALIKPTRTEIPKQMILLVESPKKLFVLSNELAAGNWRTMHCPESWPTGKVGFGVAKIQIRNH